MVLLFVKYLHVCMSISLVPHTFTRVKAHPSSVSFRFFLVMSFGQHYLRTFLAKRHGIMSLRSPGGSVIQCCVSVIHSDQTERDRCGPGIGLIVSHPHVCVCVCVCVTVWRWVCGTCLKILSALWRYMDSSSLLSSSVFFSFLVRRNRQKNIVSVCRLLTNI